MDDVAIATPVPASFEELGERPRRRAVRLRGQVGVILLGLLVLLALIGPLIVPYGVNEIDTARVLAGPDAQHLMGGDALGRDVFTRVVLGLRVSLLVALGAVTLSFLVATPIGLLAGFRGGWLDNVLMRPIDLLLAMPAMLVAVLAVSVVGPGSVVTVLAIALVYLPIFARVVRSSVLAVREAPYIDAARARGASTSRIIRTHVLPNSIGPALVQGTVLAGFAIQLEAALSFLGLGTQPPTPSLGGILADGRDFMSQAPWIEIYPGVVLALTIVAFNLVGNGLRGRLDPHGRSR